MRSVRSPIVSSNAAFAVGLRIPTSWSATVTGTSGVARSRRRLHHRVIVPGANPRLASNSRTPNPLSSCAAISARHFASAVFVMPPILAAAEVVPRWVYWAVTELELQAAPVSFGAARRAATAIGAGCCARCGSESRESGHRCGHFSIPCVLSGRRSSRSSSMRSARSSISRVRMAARTSGATLRSSLRQKRPRQSAATGSAGAGRRVAPQYGLSSISHRICSTSGWHLPVRCCTGSPLPSMCAAIAGRSAWVTLL